VFGQPLGHQLRQQPVPRGMRQAGLDQPLGQRQASRTRRCQQSQQDHAALQGAGFGGSSNGRLSDNSLVDVSPLKRGRCHQKGSLLPPYNKGKGLGGKEFELLFHRQERRQRSRSQSSTHARVRLSTETHWQAARPPELAQSGTSIVLASAFSSVLYAVVLRPGVTLLAPDEHFKFLVSLHAIARDEPYELGAERATRVRFTSGQSA
jgi:hypothetical protein